MRIENDKIEFEMSEFAPLLLENKQEGFRRIGEIFLNAVLEKEFADFIGAEKSQRGDERIDYRNGNKKRRLKTTLGELNLLRPYARNSKFETKLFENYSRTDQPLAIEMNAKWLSRKYVNWDNSLQLQQAEHEFTEIC